MAKYDFSVHYAGEGLKENRIPIRDLAPSLLSLSNTFQEIQRMINPNEPSLSLDIKASSPGSFIVDLILTNGSDLITRAMDFLNNNESNAIANLVMYADVFTGAILLIKQLAHRKVKERKELKNGEVKLTFDDKTTITIPKNVLDAYQNVEIRKNIKECIKPLEKEGIDQIDFYHSNSDKLVITKTEYADFNVPPIKPKQLDSSESTVFLQIINVAFEHGKWKFSDGSDQFFATIEDEDFLTSVAQNQQQFGSTDTLKVTLKTEQYIDKDGILRKDNTVLKVLEHVKGTQQITLDLEDDSKK